MRQIAAIALLCLGPLFLTAPVWAEGPSFDCAKAASPVEKAICASGDLSALDRQIADEYQTALSAGQTNVTEQRAWLVRRNKACAPENTADCLRSVMIERHASLTAKPEGFSSQASFDCAAPESRTDKAICDDASLSVLDAAFMKVYEAARHDVLFMLADWGAWPHDQDEWRRKRERLCGERPGLEMIECLRQMMIGETRRASYLPVYDERGREVRTDGIGHEISPIDKASERLTQARMFEDDDGFKASGAKLVGCDQMVALDVQMRAGEYKIYGGFCQVDRGGKRSRELICQDSAVRTLDVGERPIGVKEIAVFTELRCYHAP